MYSDTPPDNRYTRFLCDEPPSPPPELSREVVTRFRTLPLSELIFPDHLQLRGRGTWKTYKRAVEAVFKLKGLERHLKLPAVCESSGSRWDEEEKLCRAIIFLNIHDMEHLYPKDREHIGFYWQRLAALHEGPVGAKWVRVICTKFLSVMLGLALASLLLLIANVLVKYARIYRSAIMDRVAVLAFSSNNYHNAWAESPTTCPTSDERAKERDEWLRKEELCKAIITLNIRDFPRFGIQAGRGFDANTIWRRLVEMHTKKRRCWEGLFAWVRPLTGLEKLLLFVVMALLWHLFMVASELRGGMRRSY
ncbi:uncharacterized protein TRAVEDRAFT_20326 [Trametes versicolor FP-101664 SS1]|uniref:uncharacterized protein n=1 Tax=Trametes versicolor (strain FP-101664) TaxID=717944 RepID=UPI000462324F|nr:uncharacterized protein TRAVEDRAFT_20326 [Trametes versicolor FP-101664 SS1]EIW58263.1 hypothetical protein TRAVEDRAFT_20326 [Trametes versicolor FP-101664 SS1]